MPTNHRWAANASRMFQSGSHSTLPPRSPWRNTANAPSHPALRVAVFTEPDTPKEHTLLAGFQLRRPDWRAGRHVRNGLLSLWDREINASGVPALTAGIKNSEFHQLHKWKHRGACLSRREPINLEYSYCRKKKKDHSAPDANKRRSIQQWSHVGPKCESKSGANTTLTPEKMLGMYLYANPGYVQTLDFLR